MFLTNLVHIRFLFSRNSYTYHLHYIINDWNFVLISSDLWSSLSMVEQLYWEKELSSLFLFFVNTLCTDCYNIWAVYTLCLRSQWWPNTTWSDCIVSFLSVFNKIFFILSINSFLFYLLKRKKRFFFTFASLICIGILYSRLRLFRIAIWVASNIRL